LFGNEILRELPEIEESLFEGTKYRDRRATKREVKTFSDCVETRDFILGAFRTFGDLVKVGLGYLASFIGTMRSH
jgi:hypothetical protein